MPCGGEKGTTDHDVQRARAAPPPPRRRRDPSADVRPQIPRPAHTRRGGRENTCLTTQRWRAHLYSHRTLRKGGLVFGRARADRLSRRYTLYRVGLKAGTRFQNVGVVSYNYRGWGRLALYAVVLRSHTCAAPLRQRQWQRGWAAARVQQPQSHPPFRPSQTDVCVNNNRRRESSSLVGEFRVYL